MNGPRRLRLASAGPRVEPSAQALTPLAVRRGSIAIGETVEGAGAVAFALLLAEAFHARGVMPWLALCDFDAVPQLASVQRAGLTAHAQGSLTLQIASQAELAQLVAESARVSVDTPCVFVGEPGLIALQGALNIVLDREGAPEGLTPRARRLRQAGHLVLSSARPALARLLAEGWHLPTRAP